jgi:hypothetical protein
MGYNLDMTVNVRAHFDGRVFVPHEPVDLPVNQPLDLQVTLLAENAPNPSSAEAAFNRLMARAVKGTNISDESLRRENMYEDR